MNTASSHPADRSHDLKPAYLIAGFVFLLHVLLGNRYGYFRDELYFIDCGRHLDWGYADHAPMIGLTARIGHLLFYDSLRGLRAFSAIDAACRIILAALIARALGGGRTAIVLTSLGVLLAPVYLGGDSLFTMNAPESLYWMGCIYVAILAIQRNQPRLWIWFGVIAGLGLENKHSMLAFGFAFTVAMLLTPERRAFASQWMWIAGGIAFLIFLPNLIWQHNHHWATLELLNNVKKTHKNVELAPPAFFVQQMLMMFTATLLWLPGVVFLFVSQRMKQLRFLGWTYVVVLVVMMAGKGKDYYLAPIYPMLIAAGALWYETLSLTRRWLPYALGVVMIALTLPLVPIMLPVLPVEKLASYMHTWHLEPPKTEVAHNGPLPQYFGDQFGWPEMVARVANIYWALPPAERSQTMIFANNYGEAGAIDLFGPQYGLPEAYSAHQSHWIWGPPPQQPRSAIVLQDDRERMNEICDSVEEGAMNFHPWGMAEENQPIWVCHGLKLNLREHWPELKHWN